MTQAHSPITFLYNVWAYRRTVLRKKELFHPSFCFRFLLAFEYLPNSVYVLDARPADNQPFKRSSNKARLVFLSESSFLVSLILCVMRCVSELPKCIFGLDSDCCFGLNRASDAR